jgi:hypothetical protein
MSIPAGTVTQSVLAGAVYLTRSLSVSAMAASVWPAVFTPNLRVVRLQEFVPPVSGAGSDPSMSRSRNFPVPCNAIQHSRALRCDRYELSWRGLRSGR